MDLSNASASTYKAVVASMVARAGYSRPIKSYTSSHSKQPSQVTLAGDIFEGFWLVQPLVLNFEQGDGKIIASDDVFYMYGEGITRQDAVRDYLSTLSEYYRLLESCDDAPSAELFLYLQTYLHPKRNPR